MARLATAASAINRAITAHPLACVGYVTACRYAVFGPAVFAIRTFGLPVPTELALAYVLTRPLVKLRLPVELGVARLIAKLCPPLTQIKVSALLGILPMDRVPRGWARYDTRCVVPAGRRAQRLRKRTSGRGLWRSAPQSLVPLLRRRQVQQMQPRKYKRPSYPPVLQAPSSAIVSGGAVAKVFARMVAVADRYGAALYISRDLVGVSTMLALTAALRAGMDISGLLQRFGYGGSAGETIAETAASLAGGALIASMLSPLYLLSVGRAVPALMRAFR